MKRNLRAALALILSLSSTSCQSERPASAAASAAPRPSATEKATATATATPTARAATSAAPRAAGIFEHVYIYDIDWRNGGHALFLRGDGSGIARVAGPLKDNLQNEKRYTLPPNAERAQKIHAILETHRATSMKVHPTQAPGDQIAVVRVLANAGPEVNLRGPAGKNEPFRKLLLDLQKALEAISVDGISPSYDGKMDPYWTPPYASPSAVVTRHRLGRLEAGKLHPVATLAFDRRTSATLTIDEPGDDAEAVQRAWSEISIKDELSVKSEQEDATGHTLVGTRVRRGDKDYPAGVLNVLNVEFGVFAVEAKP